MADYFKLKSLGGCKPLPATERFHASYIAEPNSGCWLWIGRERGSNGYGSIKVDGRIVVAHRYSWILKNGPIPSGLLVCHKCDVPACVNPDHLFLGTLLDNMADCVAKGRTNGGTKSPVRGEANHNSKLKNADVLRIRSDLRAPKYIASEYGVSQTLVNKIKRKEMWRHL